MEKKALDFIRDVASGMADQELRKKYRVSGKKFIFYKAAALDIIAKKKLQIRPLRKKLNGQELLQDIKSGLDDEMLMLKYRLTYRQLQSALRKLIELGLATPLELSNRLSITKSQITQAFVEMGKAIRELD